LLALELIDSGLLLARQRGENSEVLTEVPGIAFLGDDTTRTGEAAVERIRLNPLLAHTNFWRGLSTEELTRPSRLARTTADIASRKQNSCSVRTNQKSRACCSPFPQATAASSCHCCLA